MTRDHANWLRRPTVWLKLYQVWFTAFAATTLAAASLLVGYQQMRIADMQARIAEAQALPVFEIRIHQIKDDTTGIYKNNELQADCVEGRAFSLNGDVAYFLDFTAITKTPPIKTVRFRIPVGGYFDSIFVSSATKGRVFTAAGHNNNERLGKLERSLRESDNSKYGSVVVDERTYFNLTYDDLLGRRHSEFYKVSGGADRLDDGDGKRVFADWHAGQPRMQLEQLTPDVVYAKLEAELSARQ